MYYELYKTWDNNNRYEQYAGTINNQIIFLNDDEVLIRDFNGDVLKVIKIPNKSRVLSDGTKIYLTVKRNHHIVELLIYDQWKNYGLIIIKYM